MELFDHTPSDIDVQKLNVPEILALAELIRTCSNLNVLNTLYKSSSYNDPYTHYSFGVSFFRLGDSLTAKENFIKGARFGLKQNLSLYNHPFIGKVGQCFSYLVSSYSMIHEHAFWAVQLGYLYLSKSIEMTNGRAFENYVARSFLLSQDENPMVSDAFLSVNIGDGILKEPLILSDYYFGSYHSNGQLVELLNNAENIHEWLEDISIAGKDANKYSLQEIAELGKQRHYLLYKTLEDKYIKGNLPFQEVNNSFKHHSEYFHYGHSKIIDFFESNPFGSNNPVMTFLSVLSPLDRCVILEELYNPNILNSILSDKLLLAYVTSGKIHHAKEVIQNSIRNGESEINIWGLNTKLEVGLAPKRNASERIAIFNNYLNKTQNPTEIDFLNILIDFCAKYDQG